MRIMRIQAYREQFRARAPMYSIQLIPPWSGWRCYRVPSIALINLAFLESLTTLKLRFDHKKRNANFQVLTRPNKSTQGSPRAQPHLQLERRSNTTPKSFNSASNCSWRQVLTTMFNRFSGLNYAKFASSLARSPSSACRKGPERMEIINEHGQIMANRQSS